MSDDTPFLGIDFGTSYSSMAWYNPATGQAELLKNTEGEDKTPSVVYFGDEILVGAPADELLADEADAARVVVSVKRDLTEARVALPGGRRLTPVDVAAWILAKLKHDAEIGHFHRPVHHAVITCPARFDFAEREQIELAARQAGFAEVTLLEEPVAAALAFQRAGFAVGQAALVYDLGGGTFDVAVLSYEDDGFRLALPPEGLRKCGGDDFDRALYDDCASWAHQELSVTVGRTGALDMGLLRECRRQKEQLSARTQSRLVYRLADGAQVKRDLTRTAFEELIQGKVGQTVRLTQGVLKQAATRGVRVETVVLIGGSARIPLVKQLLGAALPSAPLVWEKQDVAVALGAAHHAQQLWGNVRSTRVPGVTAPKTSSAPSTRRVASASARPDEPSAPPQPVIPPASESREPAESHAAPVANVASPAHSRRKQSPGVIPQSVLFGIPAALLAIILLVIQYQYGTVIPRVAPTSRVVPTISTATLPAATEAMVQAATAVAPTAAAPTAPVATAIPPGQPIGAALPSWVPELVPVPAGPFLMGSSAADSIAYDDEKPQHQLELPDYWIGKTEVTNAQFRPFVEGDGYTNPEYWTAAGWAWREEDNIQQPAYWNEPQWNGDNQPVVGVNWFEAVAYVRWLSAQTGHEFRLPTEAEWEKAARGPDGLIYPWGDNWDAARLNSGDSVGQTTPVGAYPQGASSYGALDMAGNAWEWCAAAADKYYPYTIEDEWAASYLEPDEARIVRGGSWTNIRTQVRGAYRVGDFPRVRSIYGGLRVASHAPPPGSDS